MAKLIVCAAYDSKIQNYAQPFFMRTKGEAIRAWTEVSNDTSTNIGKYPEDFSLMELGEYDEASGSFSNHQAPINLGLASQYKKQLNNLTQLTEGKLN